MGPLSDTCCRLGHRATPDSNKRDGQAQKFHAGGTYSAIQPVTPQSHDDAMNDREAASDTVHEASDSSGARAPSRAL